MFSGGRTGLVETGLVETLLCRAFVFTIQRKVPSWFGNAVVVGMTTVRTLSHGSSVVVVVLAAWWIGTNAWTCRAVASVDALKASMACLSSGGLMGIHSVRLTGTLSNVDSVVVAKTTWAVSALEGAVGTRCTDTSVRTLSDRPSMDGLDRRSMSVSTGVMAGVVACSMVGMSDEERSIPDGPLLTDGDNRLEIVDSDSTGTDES